MDTETPRRRLTRAQAKAQTRERLLDAAARLFARQGFAGTSVEEIAEAAGYSVGALYSNFTGKEQLFLELVATRVSNRMGLVAEILETDPAGEDPLGDLSRLLVRAADRNAEFVALQAEIWLHAVHNPEFMEAMAGQLRAQVGVLERLVGSALAQRGDALPEAAVREVTVVVFSLFQGLVRQRLIEPDSVPADLFGRAVRWLFTGLRATASGDGDPALRSAGADVLCANAHS